MRLAVISDVHGNVEALRRVIAHLERQSVDAVVNLGDCVTAPLWPRETFELLGELGAETVRGNHDRWLGDAERITASPTIAFTAEQLSSAARDALVKLPATRTLFDDVLAVHGVPTSDTEYLLEENVDGRLRLVDTRTLAARIGDTQATLVLCGHSHLQHSACVAGRLVVNPGSVGCPRYAGNDDVDRNEAGSPHARYAIAERRDGSWSAELFVLEYDWSRVVRRATEVGREDWARSFIRGFE